MENYLGSKHCSCGREHDIAIDDVIVGKGVIQRLPEFVAKYQAKKPFILADKNTYKAADETVEAILRENGVSYSTYVFRQENLEPNEEAVGSAFMHFDSGCDLIIGVGSGVINDIGKILSNISGRKYMIVGTAPSMDGYASATSSMSMDGLKVSLGSRCADVIIGDVDIQSIKCTFDIDHAVLRRIVIFFFAVIVGDVDIFHQTAGIYRCFNQIFGEIGVIYVNCHLQIIFAE